jgi:hypothetical protein
VCVQEPCVYLLSAASVVIRNKYIYIYIGYMCVVSCDSCTLHFMCRLTYSRHTGNSPVLHLLSMDSVSCLLVYICSLLSFNTPLPLPFLTRTCTQSASEDGIPYPGGRTRDGIPYPGVYERFHIWLCTGCAPHREKPFPSHISIYLSTHSKWTVHLAPGISPCLL